MLSIQRHYENFEGALLNPTKRYDRKTRFVHFDLAVRDEPEPDSGSY